MNYHTHYQIPSLVEGLNDLWARVFDNEKREKDLEQKHRNDLQSLERRMNERIASLEARIEAQSGDHG
ncbi:hypothetical protein [Ruegeria sp.]|uniref:hypothetical protein n=1 Tax=Ruegeria sp. TaxID=1879320 RepID=UPI003C7A2CB3